VLQEKLQHSTDPKSVPKKELKMKQSNRRTAIKALQGKHSKMGTKNNEKLCNKTIVMAVQQR
jgi:hypothetical protein